MTESYPAPPPKRDHSGYSDNKNCFLSSDVLVDIVKNCTFLKTHHDDVILRQGDRGDRYVFVLCVCVLCALDDPATSFVYFFLLLFFYYFFYYFFLFIFFLFIFLFYFSVLDDLATSSIRNHL